jgi:hypothetical protein
MTVLEKKKTISFFPASIHFSHTVKSAALCMLEPVGTVKITHISICLCLNGSASNSGKSQLGIVVRVFPTREVYACCVCTLG